MPNAKPKIIPTMSLLELAQLDREWLRPREVAPLIGTDPHTLVCTAKQKPHLLGFPVVIVGTTEYSRVKIPRIPFLRFMGV